MWHAGDKHKSKLGLMKSLALMALRAKAAEKGLNACSLTASFMSDLFTQQPWVWACRCLISWCKWSGLGVKCYSMSFSCRRRQSLFLMRLIKFCLLVWVSWVNPGNNRYILGVNVMCCCICECCDICAEPREGSTVGAGVVTWQERRQPPC